MYGHITTWETGGVTDMGCLFVAKSDDSCDHVYNSGAKSFNDNIGAWDTSGVVDMNRMFFGAKAFNQPIGNWSVGAVTNMRSMFNRASSFNQAIGDWRDRKFGLSTFMELSRPFSSTAPSRPVRRDSV